MKFKLAVPRDVLNMHQINLIESSLRAGLLRAVTRNFPNWGERAAAGDITGGEIILQDTDLTQPIVGLKPGIHVTISLVSFQPERNFDGLAEDTIDLIKLARDEKGWTFMEPVGVFVQMTLNQMVVKAELPGHYVATTLGENLLEYSG